MTSYIHLSIHLGLLTSAVHGPQSIGKEIENNLNLLRRSSLIVDDPDFSSNLSDYCYEIVYTKK